MRSPLPGAALILALGAVLANDVNGETPLVVGLLLPPDEPDAASLRQGALVAVEEANARGGRPVRLAVRGRKGPWGSDASEATRLVEDDGASALLAPPGGAASHLVLQVAGRTGVPVASLCPDLSVTRTALPWMVRVAPSTSDEARIVLAAGGVPRWLAFVPAGRAGREASRDLAAAASGRTTVQTVEMADPPPFEKVKELMSAVRPNGILLWLDPAASGRLARSLRAAGYTGLLAGPLRLASPVFSAEAREAAEGVLLPVIAEREGASRETFEKKYRALFRTEPDPAAALAHDAAALLIGLVRRPGVEAARRAFPFVEPAHGATGPMSFDVHGNRIVLLEARRFRAGRLVPG